MFSSEQSSTLWLGPDGAFYSYEFDRKSCKKVCRLFAKRNSNVLSNKHDDKVLPNISFQGMFRENAKVLRQRIFQLSNRDIMAGIEVVFLGKSVPTTSRFIIYQLEQRQSACLNPQHPDFNPVYLEAIRDALAIWDCSPANVNLWRKLGKRSFFVPLWSMLPSASLMPPMALPEGHLEYSSMAPSELSCKSKGLEGNTTGPIDVLLFGTMNQRREDMRDKLQAAGLRAVVRRFTDLMDQERHVAAARVILNVHFYSEAALEVHRVDPLLARGKCVVSEVGSDAALDAVYSQVVVFAPYSDLVAAVKSLVESGNGELQSRATSAFRFMKERISSYPWELHHAVEAMKSIGADEDAQDPSLKMESEDFRKPIDGKAWIRWKSGIAVDDDKCSSRPSDMQEMMGEAVWKILGQWQHANQHGT